MKWTVRVADNELDRRAGESLDDAKLRARKTVQIMIAAALVENLARLGLSDTEILAEISGVRSKADADRLLERLERANVVH
jgi:hypothetical protein